VDKDENIQSNKTISDSKFNISDLKLLFIILAPASLGFGLFTASFLGLPFDKLGTYGDFIGGGTIPFLTIASILFILDTIKLQKKQVELQEKEIVETRKTLEEQNKTARMQRFENTFFKLIDQIKIDLEDLVEEFDVSSSTTFFKILQQQLRTYMNEKKSKYQTVSYEENEEAYLRNHGELLKVSFRELKLKQSYSTFTSHTEHVLQLILKYKSHMEDWEVSFYLNLFFLEVGQHGISMLLYDSALRTGIKFQFVRELNLINYTDPLILNSRSDYEFIKFVMETDYNIDET
jgi:hypothetical protein